MGQQRRNAGRRRHYLAVFREAGTLVLVFAALDGVFFRERDVHWFEVGAWFLAGMVLVLVGIHLDQQEEPT